MYVRGPGVPAGERRPHPTNLIDITATIAELAGGAAKFAPHALDGQSFAAALTSSPPALSAWRDFSYSEAYMYQVRLEPTPRRPSFGRAESERKLPGAAGRQARDHEMGGRASV